VIVFSNTTPFIALASIDRLALLPQLFYKVHVAESVIHECAEGGRILVPSLRTLDWVIPVADETASALPFLLELDRGEKQTIVLAQKHGADRVIIGQLGQLGGGNWGNWGQTTVLHASVAGISSTVRAEPVEATASPSTGSGRTADLGSGRTADLGSGRTADLGSREIGVRPRFCGCGDHSFLGG